MIRNYLLISLRNLRKHVSYSFINISGLGLGLATCLLLVTWIRHELSYDRFHEKSERIYRVSLEYSFGGQVARPSVSPNALLPALLELTESETGVRVYNPSQHTPYVVRNGEKVFEEEKFYLADSTFFNVFSFNLLQGNPRKALADPYSLVLSQAMAQKYFGHENILGKMLRINNTREYKVTGVMANAPSNSLLQLDFIGSFNSIAAGREEPTWWSANYQTFIVIRPDAKVQAMEEQINALVKEKLAAELTGQNDYVRYNFLPLTDIYLRSEFDEAEVVGDIQYVYIFSAVTLLILVIACINYVNLATARAAGRAKEVGVRKVSGALRNQLFAQFIGESLVITSISFMLAFLLAQLLLPFFNSLTGKNFSYAILLNPEFISYSLLGLMVIALAAGAYPALALAAFNPVHVLKGNFKSSGRGIWMRKALVVFQFGISVILITGTLIVIRQLDFIRSKKLGFDRENTIILPLDLKTDEAYETLKTELKRSGLATHVSRGSASPFSVKAGYSMNASDKEGPGIIVTGLLADEEYIPAVGIDLIVGRNFTTEDRLRLKHDTVYSFIVNEAALDALYIPVEHAVGSAVSMFGRRGEIIGVVGNFHFSSLHDPIGPLVMFPEEREFSKVFIKMPPGNVSQALQRIEEVYSNILTHRPFEYAFLDQQYAAMYDAEKRMGVVAVVFSTLAMIIACLGLFGLVAFAAEQKKKEIGIRKVLGATSSGIVFLLTRDFSRLVFVAIIGGLPIAYWIVSTYWLNEFAYKTEIGVWPFAIATLVCICVAFGTTGYQAVKASLIDPAETLRNE